MAIVLQSGFLALVEDVRTFFVANGVTAKVGVGWRQRTQQMNQGPGGANRVIFIPSGSKAGAGGKMSQARYPGPRGIRDPEGIDPDEVIADVRSLATWERSVLVSVWAYDPTKREDEAVQIEAAEDLFEWTVRAVHASGLATIKWESAEWSPPGERAHGLELTFGFTIQQPVFDTPRELVMPGGVAVNRGNFPVAPSGGGDT